jgi:hypothetical protein
VNVTLTGIRSRRNAILGLAALIFFAAGALAQDTHPSQGGSSASPATNQPASKDNNSKEEKKEAAEPATAKLRITVVDPKGNPVDNASVYVRFNEAGGLFHKDKLAELSFKTNQQGALKVPEVPQGRVMVQVIAKNWHTFGQWYDVNQDEQVIAIKLEPPVKWY